MVVSSEGREVDVLVLSEKVELGTILRMDDATGTGIQIYAVEANTPMQHSYGIVAHMSYREDEKIGSKQELIARVQIFGKLDSGRLIRIKRPIKPHTDVFLAEDKELEQMLSAEDNISIGMVRGTKARAFLNPNEYDRHMAILASTGAGKSYTAANLVKEFSSLGLPTIIVDTHGEYPKLLSKLIENTGIRIEVYTVKHGRQGYRQFRIPVSALEPEDFNHFTFLTEPQGSALSLVLDRLSENYQIKDIIDGCGRLNDKTIHEGTIKALERKLRILDRIFKDIFDIYGTDIKKLVQPYQITIIDTSSAPQGVRQSVVSYIAKELLQGRIRKYNEISDSIENPMLFVVEEAHNYAGANISHSCKYQLRRIASEGRKFDVGLCVISQKPGKIDEEILSQCNTGIYMHITNPNDKDHIRKSFESINDEIIKDLDSLDAGECIIAGAMNRIPFLVCNVDMIDVRGEKIRKFNYKREEEITVGGFDYV